MKQEIKIKQIKQSTNFPLFWFICTLSYLRYYLPFPFRSVLTTLGSTFPPFNNFYSFTIKNRFKPILASLESTSSPFNSPYTLTFRNINLNMKNRLCQANWKKRYMKYNQHLSTIYTNLQITYRLNCSSLSINKRKLILVSILYYYLKI